MPRNNERAMDAGIRNLTNRSLTQLLSRDIGSGFSKSKESNISKTGEARTARRKLIKMNKNAIKEVPTISDERVSIIVHQTLL